MKREKILWCSWLAFLLASLFVLIGTAHAQQPTPNSQAFPPDRGPYQSGVYYLLPQVPVPQVGSGTVQPNQSGGSTSYFYWVVTMDVDNGLWSLPAGPFPTSIGPASLSSFSFITLSFPTFTTPLTYGLGNGNYTAQTTSNIVYDVLETSTATPPSGTCTCAVQIGATSSTVKDTGTRSSYTVHNFTWPYTYPAVGDVVQIGPQGQLIDGGNAVAVPAPPPFSIQFNNAGVFGGNADLTYQPPGTPDGEFFLYTDAANGVQLGMGKSTVFGANEEFYAKGGDFGAGFPFIDLNGANPNAALIQNDDATDHAGIQLEDNSGGGIDLLGDALHGGVMEISGGSAGVNISSSGGGVVVDADATDGLDLGVAGTHLFRALSSALAFYGTSPIAKPTVSGSQNGNAALGSLLTALSNLGLLTNSTTTGSNPTGVQVFSSKNLASNVNVSAHTPTTVDSITINAAGGGAPAFPTSSGSYRVQVCYGYSLSGGQGVYGETHVSDGTHQAFAMASLVSNSNGGTYAMCGWSFTTYTGASSVTFTVTVENTGAGTPLIITGGGLLGDTSFMQVLVSSSN